MMSGPVGCCGRARPPLHLRYPALNDMEFALTALLLNCGGRTASIDGSCAAAITKLNATCLTEVRLAEVRVGRPVR
jgi:hypothetical protein